MNVLITPTNNLARTIKIPASKSLLHRDLICASLAKGKSHIHNVTLNDDVNATISCLRNLGVKISIDNDILEVTRTEELKIVDPHFYPKESGSTLRFMIPIVGLLVGEAYFHLEGKLGKRPLADYQEIFEKNDCLFVKPTESELLINGPLSEKEFLLNGNVTSQYISGLLMASPLIEGLVKIHVTKPVESVPYITLTIEEMRKFGVEIEIIETKTEIIYQKKPGSYYKQTDVVVEGDFSQAAFFLGLGVINQPTYLINMNKKSFQGDAKILDFLIAMGANIAFEKETLVANAGTFKKKITDVTLDLIDTPDLAPILMALAAITPRKTRLINTHRLIYKESNRSKAMQTELTKLGSKIEVFENEIIIEGIALETLTKLKQIIFDSHHDHRVIMSLAIIATTFNPQIQVMITDIWAVSKSYPTFFDDLAALGIKFTLEK